MPHMQIELAARYAQEAGARSTWFAYAEHTPDLLAKIALVGPDDHLVVFADDFASAFASCFPWDNVTFIADPEPASFLAASGWMTAVDAAGLEPAGADDGSGGAAADDRSDRGDCRGDDDRGAALAHEGSPASYAYPAGRGARRTFWFVASIGGMGLRVPDIRALAQAATAAGALLIVDNTVPSLFGCRPLALGAHLVFEALDRIAAGRLDRKVVAVCVARAVQGRGRKRVASPQAEDAFRLVSFGLGAPDRPAPAMMLAASDLAAIAAGLDTLPARMQAHVDHARAIAEYLRCHPQIGHAWYPGLTSHPDHERAARVIEHGCGPAIDFTLTGAADERPVARHRRFLAQCACAHRDAPAGGAATRMNVLERESGAFIRMFAGTDDPLYVADSLDQALRLFCNPPEP